MRSGYRRTVGSAALALVTVACSGAPPPSAQRTVPPTPGPRVTASAAAAPGVDPATVHADELGSVPVLMYHQLLAHPRSDYDQTPAQFRAEVELLYRSGYRTVTAADLVAGRIGVPAGRSPMVLTFDDSTASQYRERADGSVDPASAVGILLAVGHRYGEDRPVASFYVNAAPFAGKDAYLTRLSALGMEVGDHTATHANLRQLDDNGVQRELVQGLTVIRGPLPTVPVTTMALPYGALPHHTALDHRGSWKGLRYDFHGVLLVGSNPALSPFRRGFDPLAVPRIRSGNHAGDQTFTATYWLPRLRTSRYVSDGNPDTVSFPRGELGRLDPLYASRARPY